MNIDYEQQLKEKFPFIQCGIACEDGWFGLLFVLCFRIKKYLAKNNIQNYQVTCIKEKFGTLRFYDNSSFNEIIDLIQEAEDASAATCEICGKPGILRQNRPWIRTLCDECNERIR